MFRQLKMYSFMCDRKYAKCRTEADANDNMVFTCIHCPDPCADPEGDFLSNTGPYPLKFSKLQSQHSTLGHHGHASETPFKGVSLAGR